MLVNGTPVEDHVKALGLWVKREDLSCPPPGPPFSKTRGVFAHVAARPEKLIGVLDTYHSQAGHAVAQACKVLGKECLNFYPVRKADSGADLQPQQLHAQALGAGLCRLQAGRSAILYHQAKKLLKDFAVDRPHYLMPNALKLPEMVSETVEEVMRTNELNPGLFSRVNNVIVACSSGTIASGVIRGLWALGWKGQVILHQGYSRPTGAFVKYVGDQARIGLVHSMSMLVVDEGYGYGDKARRDFEMPPWPSNPYYDLKAFRWWVNEGRARYKEALLWNIG